MMESWLVLLELFLLFCTTIGFSEDSGVPFVNIPSYGQMVGSISKSARTEREIFQFFGVKYAESSRGNRRFRDPTPARAWHGVRDNSKPFEGCPSAWLMDAGFSVQNSDPEDCLHMSIFSNDMNARKPVIVFIYADYFSKGAAKDFKPDFILEKDVVLVIPQFRLGPFGFISTKDKDIPGNVGVKDVVAALEWIRKYIIFFGGDSHRVTLAGHSGGAAIVQLMTMNKMVHLNLFQKVIIVSGSFFSPWAVDQDPLNNPLYVEHPQLCLQDREPGACLRDISASELVNNFFEKKNKKRQMKIYDYEYRLVVDGSDGVVPEMPVDLFASNFKIHKTSYPTLLGVTREGGANILAEAYKRYEYIADHVWNSPQAFTKNYMIYVMLHILGIHERTGLLNVLLEKDFFRPEAIKAGTLATSLDGLLDMFNTIHVKSPILMAAKSAALRKRDNVYLYSLHQRGERSLFLDGNQEKVARSPFKGGIVMKDDLQYLFPRWDNESLNHADTQISHMMVELWTSFARENIPSIGEFKTQPPPFLNLTGPYLKIQQNPEIGEDFLEEFFTASRYVDTISE